MAPVGRNAAAQRRAVSLNGGLALRATNARAAYGPGPAGTDPIGGSRPLLQADPDRSAVGAGSRQRSVGSRRTGPVGGRGRPPDREPPKRSAILPRLQDGAGSRPGLWMRRSDTPTSPPGLPLAPYLRDRLSYGRTSCASE